MLLTLALLLTCTLVGSVRLSGADGGGGRKARGRVLRVALVGDPQVDDSTEMGYARRSVYRELYGRRDLDMCIFLGDLVNDNMTLLPESVGVVDSLPYQCFMVPGNHDRDVYRGPKSSSYRPRDLSTWRKVVGYVDTSFVRSNIRFILMNNVRHSDSGMTDYVGGFTETQKHWLDSVLNVGAPALTVLATHIPFSQMKGRDSVLALVPEAARMLYVSGHTHYVSRMNPFRNSLSARLAEVGGAVSRMVTEFPMPYRVAALREGISLQISIATDDMTFPINALADRLRNNCPHGQSPLVQTRVLTACVSMSSAALQTALSAFVSRVVGEAFAASPTFANGAIPPHRRSKK